MYLDAIHCNKTTALSPSNFGLLAVDLTTANSPGTFCSWLDVMCAGGSAESHILGFLMLEAVEPA